ncbi:domain found in IF2B/IF5-domain-containing protein [Gigaspora rosea]|uniref:Domain found in IF2B/IF5-domain-containing protein n=1 Tax=Gigaspora rosea TaxID=44941 RepID=A0A397UB99_9GLOM|nr:domain found in IF2B/IF5-domain-containing protein [Gigaspora rosea]
MALINIGGNNQDRFYRYKMPKLISKIEGKGNGIKTVVPNMSDIARSLSRPPTYPTKFFGCELGAQVKCDEKHDRYIVNGAHEAAKLQELLDVFIKKYVLCAGCHNPETDLVCYNYKIIRDCKACGQRTDVDMRHKLVTYILKYPPSPPKSKSGKTKKKKGEDDEQGSPTTKGSSEEGTDDELTRRIEAEAANLPTADQYKDDDDWALDTSAEAVAKRTKEFSKLLLDDSGSDEEDGDPYEQLDKWLEENATSASSNDIYKKIKELGVSKEIDQVLKHLVLGLFAKSFQKNISNINKHIHKKAKLLQKFVQNPDGQKALLGATEVLVSENKELFESRIICSILMGYYQNDLLEEEVFKAWLEGDSSDDYQNLFKRTASVNYVDAAINQDIRNKAKPFAKWLEEAEEDDDDDEDDD